MSQVIDALQWRYAVKKFDGERMLSRKQIETLKEAFNLTATSYGLQPVKMMVIADKVLQEELVPLSMNQRQVGDCSYVLVLCIENVVDGAFVKNYFDRVQAIRNTPDEVIAGFKNYLVSEYEKMTPEAIAMWATKQAYLILGNLLTICAVEGIDACPMEGFDPKAYDDKLGLTKLGLSSVLVLPVGYRAEDDMFAEFAKVRRPLEEIVIEL